MNRAAGSVALQSRTSFRLSDRMSGSGEPRSQQVIHSGTLREASQGEVVCTNGRKKEETAWAT